MNDSEVSLAPHFQGFQNRSDGRWIQGQELLLAIQHFVAVHVGHESGVIETDDIILALEPFEIEREPFRWFENVEDLMAEEVSQVPDAPPNEKLLAKLRSALREAANNGRPE